MALQASTIAPYLLLQASRIVKSAPAGGTQMLSDVHDLTCTQGSYGTIGVMDVETSISDWQNARLASFKLRSRWQPDAAPWQCKRSGGDGKTPIFTGVVDEEEFELEHDNLKLHCRDAGAVLMERTVVPKQATDQSSISDFVNQIISDANLTVAHVEDVTQSNGEPIRIGTFFQDKHYFNLVKETTWGVLERLAKVTGNVVYVQADGRIYFGPRNTYGVFGTKTVSLKFARGTKDSDFTSLKVTHNSYRHSAFTLQVHSHNRDGDTTTRLCVAYVNPDLAHDAGLEPGLLVGLPVGDREHPGASPSKSVRCRRTTSTSKESCGTR